MVRDTGHQTAQQIADDLARGRLALNRQRQRTENLLALAIMVEQRVVDATCGAAMRAGRFVECAFEEQAGQIRPLGPVDYKPDFRIKCPAAGGAGKLDLLGSRPWHLPLPHMRLLSAPTVAR